MADNEEMEVDQTAEIEQDDAESNGEDDSLQDAETSGIQEKSGEPSKSRKKKKGRKGGKKSKSHKDSAPAANPDIHSLDEICQILSISDTKMRYTDEEFEDITNLKAYTSRFRVRFQDLNPNVNATKIQPYVIAKYRQFQELAKNHKAKSSAKDTSRESKDKVQPLKIRITRKKRVVNTDDDENSDREFEQILKEHEKQLDDAEKAKEERRQSRRAAQAAKKKAAADEIEHQDYCEACQQGGEILLCDTCPRAYHLICLELTETPEGDWMCPHCEENGIPIKEPEEQKRGNMEYCRVCSEGGFLLCCDTCPSSFHAYCLDPPLAGLPPADENWSCPRCLVPQPRNKPERLITWRFKFFEYPEPVAEEDLLKEGETQEEIDPERHTRLMLRPPRKLEPRRERELFVKWKYMSFWNCEWIPEFVLEIFYPQSVRMYWRKVDPDHPPEIEDLPTKHTENDPLDLEHRFYRYGIKPEWLR